MHRLFTRFINLLFDNSCLICNKPACESFVCMTCENAFILRKQNYTKYFQKITVYSWALYDGRLRQGIIALKGGKKKLSTYFSSKLIDFWETIPEKVKNKNYLVIPVPSHKKRIKERGYCQTSLIASAFARSLGFSFSKDFIIRKKETLFMNSLGNINERIENIKNAFEIIDDLKEDKPTLIIDDILTSGSTICELSRTIHQKYPEAELIGLTVSSGDTYNF